MKQTHLTSLGIGILGILVLAIVLIAGHRTAEQFARDNPQTVETRPITANNQTGGSVSDDSSDDTAQDNSPRSTTDSTESVAPRPQQPRAATRPAVIDESVASRAPRQYELSRTVTTEHRYRALEQPNDPLVSTSWALPSIRASQAWSQSTGSPVTVAIIDTGFALDHEDLSAQWHINRDETGTDANGKDKSKNGIDDDNNGYIDDWRGWDFVGNGTLPDNEPQAGRLNPGGNAAEHGTSVAGLAGASTNNGIGIASLNWHTSLMPLQVLDDNGEGFTSGVISAVYYAVDNGAKVINMSLGSDFPDSVLADAIEYAHQHNVIVIAAAGNCGQGCTDASGQIDLPPGTMSYPALDRHVISVGATNSTDARAVFSSYGPGLDVMAPGSGTITAPTWTSSNGTNLYASTLYGTSFAAPIVTSVVSLLVANHPAATTDSVLSIIDGGARKPSAIASSFYNTDIGHGIVNAETATRLAAHVATTTTNEISLQQAGSHLSEHTFLNSSILGSGCTALPGVYCTIHARDIDTGFDRYLPYALTGSDGKVGWTWPGSLLGTGHWVLDARAGLTASSVGYGLFQK